jgi:predicted SprT family Zn-dependent metalloprotease
VWREKPAPGVIYRRRGRNVGGRVVQAGDVRLYPEISLDTYRFNRQYLFPEEDETRKNYDQE